MREWLVRRAEGALDSILGRVLWIVAVAALFGIGILVWAAFEEASGPAIALFGAGAFFIGLWTLIGLRTLRPSVGPLLGRGRERQDRVLLQAIVFANLGPREHGGVLWRGTIRDGVVRAGGPFCPEDGDELRYKPSTPRFRVRAAFEDLITPPAILTQALGSPPVAGKQEESEEEKLGLRDLRDDDTSGDNSGPYCTECKRLRRIPKRVGDCRWEAVQLFEQDYIASC